ncbi:MAG: cyclopropane-fatty-acyl-phospholipid synthase family protein [Hyphomicrobiaceae bacterium]
MFPLSKMLSHLIRVGTLTVYDAEGRRHVYSGSTPGPSVNMKLSDPRLYKSLFFSPEMAAGEAYMDGTLTFPESSLRAFLDLLSQNRNLPGGPPSSFHRAVGAVSRRFKHLQQANPIGKAQQNIAHHYDIGNALYHLFLDDGLFYSCAYFENDDDTLEQAQVAKCRLIAAKLDLQPGQKILDIGCGWGGLAIYLAKMEDVQVHGVTLSKEQHALAVERAEKAGVAKRVRFELRDYRELDQKFDRIVSVGMFEHVGVPRYDEFFAKVNTLMPDDGVMLLHSIGHMSPPSTASPWLRKYIFPGAYSPSLSEVFPAVERNRLWVTDCEFLRLHYAMTLRHWHTRFEANRARIAEMYDERFCRMWEFYLISAEMMFRSGAQEVFHMQLSRKRDASPIRRDYIFEAQQKLRQREAAAAG